MADKKPSIVAYHRPKTLAEALSALANPDILTLPLGGGTFLNAGDALGAQAYPVDKNHPAEDFAVVDLQALGLNHLYRRGNSLVIEAAVTLQALVEAADLLPALSAVARRETTYNLRQVATVAGTLVAGDGRSPFTTALLALDAQLILQPGDETLALGQWLRPAEKTFIRRRLITQVVLPVNVGLAYEAVARTPADQPIVCAALARWPSGRTRLALGGHGRAPILAMDGPDAQGVATAARSAYSQAADSWASAEYRAEMAAVLTQRGLAALTLPQAGGQENA